MVEDFYNESSNTSFSSVSIQFLIEIINTPTCLSKPIISSNLSANTIVQVGISFNFTCNNSIKCPGTTIIDFFRTPPLHMYKSNITFDAVNNISIVTETWTPTNDQIGSQVYCAIATDRYSLDFIYINIYILLDISVSIQSDLYSSDIYCHTDGNW